MASKVEILGGQLDGSVLDNAATESTLRELVDAIKKLQTAVNTTAKASAGGGKGGASGGGTSGGKAAGPAPEINTDGANKSVDQLGSSAKQGSAGVNALARAAQMGAKGLANSMINMGGLLMSGNSSLSSFVGSLGAMPGVIGTFATALSSGIRSLEEMQETQRDLAQSGASFNNSMMDMRIAAAESGLSLSEYSGFVKSNSKNLAGFGDTITEGAQRMSELGSVVGQSGVAEDFMKLGLSASGARLATMQFAANLVKGDKVRSASAGQLAAASLAYESQMDMLSKQTGQTRDALKKMGDDIVKDSGALTMSFAGMGPEAQAAMKGVFSTVSATMGDGAKQAMIDMASGASVGTTEASRYFTAMMPEVTATFKEMEKVAKDTSLTKADREKKLLDLQAEAQVKQQQYLQSDAGKKMMADKAFMSGAQKEFVTGLEKNQAAMAEAGYDIQNATIEEIQAKNAAKKAEQDKQASLDAGMNRLQNIFKTVGAALQTGFFKILSEGLNSLFAVIDIGTPAFTKLFSTVGSIITPIIAGIKLFGDELGMIGGRLGGAFTEVVASVQPVIDQISSGFTTLSEVLGPVVDVFRDWLQPALEGVSDFIQQNLTPIVGAVVTVLGTMAVMALPAIISGLVAFGVSLVTAAAAILAPFIGVIAVVAAVAAGFILLKKAGWDFGTAIEAVKDNLKRFGLGFNDIITTILEALGPRFGGISEEEAKARKAQSDVERAILDDREKARDVQRAKNVVANKIDDAKIVAQNATVREEKAIARDTKEAADKKKDAIRAAENADAMVRSKDRAIAGMRDLAGITKPGPAVAPSPGYGPAAPGGKVPSGALANMQGLQSELTSKGITDPKAVANIMAQVQAESGGVAKSENLKYSGKKLFELYGAGNKGGNKVRFKTVEEADAVAAKGEEAVGNVIYGGRMGNKEDEGYKYRGRGLIQLTGKDNYKKFGDMIGVDLVKNPDMANDPAIAQKLAAAYFSEKEKKGVNLSDINAVGKAVGYAGGAAETAKRSQLADGFSAQLAGGSAPTTQTAAATPTPVTKPAIDPKAVSDWAWSVFSGKADPSTVPEQYRSAVNDILKTPPVHWAQAAGKAPTVQTAAKPTTPGGTVPNGTGVVAATTSTTPVTTTQTASVDKAAADKAAADKAAQTQLASTTPATNPITEVIASLNTSLAQLTMMQGKAIAIAEQQLRATNGLSRDAYKSV